MTRRDGADGPMVELTARGRDAVAFGLGVLGEIEQGWRAALGDAAFGAFAHALARLNLGR